MKRIAYLFAVLLAYCSAFARADAVVLANRARQAVSIELADRELAPQIVRLSQGAARSFSVQAGAELRFTSGGESRHYELEPGKVYFFHDRGGASPTELAQISLRHVERPPIADDAVPPGEAPHAEPADAGRAVGVFRLPVKILVDETNRAARRYWEPRLRRRLKTASRIFKRACGIGFEVVDAEV